MIAQQRLDKCMLQNPGFFRSGRSVMVLCVALYVGGALLGFDAYDTVCISAHWVVQRGQGTPSAVVSGCISS